jgi:3-phenylpropionate/trans-cinnamate dioxygenase ferredoxin subunit
VSPDDDLEEATRMEFVRVGALAEVPEGEVRAYDTPAGRVSVAHVEQRVFAFGDECTHMGCSLADGEFSDREGTIECPCHGSVFDVATGEPIEGPARDPVPVYPARVTDDGWVEVGSEPGTEGETGA